MPGAKKVKRFLHRKMRLCCLDHSDKQGEIVALHNFYRRAEGKAPVI